MRIIGYTRLSRASREESTSIVRQHRVIESTCSARGLDLVGIVDDVDVSATKHRLERPGLREVRARIDAGEADAVMVWRLDRIARSVVDFGLLLDAGLNIISATEPLDTTTPMGRAMAEVLQVFAALEAKTIGLRIAASQAHLREVGRFPGGVVPYGYRSVPHPDGVGRALEPDPVESAVVRRMADEVLAGAAVYTVAQRLNADGVPPRRSAAWSTTSVARILRSDAVLGRVRRKGEPVRGEDGLPVQFWPPILPVDDVLRLRALTDWTPRGRAGLKPRRAARLLSGLLECASCGSALVVRRRKDAPSVYGCSAAARGRACGRGTVIECDRVEAEVERQFLDLLGPFRVVEEVITAPEVAGLAEVEEALAATAREMTAPDADVPALLTRLESLRAERVRLDALPKVPESSLIETGATFAEEWGRRDVVGRRALLVGTGAEVVLRHGQRGRWDPSRVSLVLSRAL